jgi:hypothetical protein
MKYLPIILSVFSALLTLGILTLFVTGFIAWLGGGFNIVLPGPGLVIGGAPVLIALLVTGIIMFAVTVLLARKIFRDLP